MKKLSFILAMVLGTGMAMAQKTTTITQSGNNNDAFVTQNAIYSGDVTTIHAFQTGTLNELTTDQTGLDNHLDLTQGNGGGNNTATMTQLSENYEIAEIWQTSNSNTATLTQNGASNKYAYLDQLSNSNLGTITQNDGGVQYARLQQFGDLNTGTINQNDGGQQWVDLTQRGLYVFANYDNRAYINQVGFQLQDVKAYQTGNYDYSNIKQVDYNWQLNP